MKLSGRLQAGTVNGYEEISIQLLNINPSSLLHNTIGFIKFRLDESTKEIVFYGVEPCTYNFVIDTAIDFGKVCTQLNKFIHYSYTIDEFMNEVNFIEYVVQGSNFLPISANGQNLYKVMVKEGHYTTVFAADFKAARRKVDRFHSLDNYELIKVSKIEITPMLPKMKYIYDLIEVKE